MSSRMCRCTLSRLPWRSLLIRLHAGRRLGENDCRNGLGEPPGMTAAPAGWVGRSIERVEDAALLTGRARFIDDLAVRADTLHAAVLRSPHAHAVIRAIDAEAARAAPGVAAVL